MEFKRNELKATKEISLGVRIRKDRDTDLMQRLYTGWEHAETLHILAGNRPAPARAWCCYTLPCGPPEPVKELIRPQPDIQNIYRYCEAENGLMSHLRFRC